MDDYTKDRLKDLSSQIDKIDDKIDNIQTDVNRQVSDFQHHEKHDRKDIQKIQHTLTNIDEKLDEYNKQLDTHISNSNANTSQLKILSDKVLPIVEANQAEKVIREWTEEKAKKTKKILALVTTIAAAAASVLKLLGYF